MSAQVKSAFELTADEVAAANERTIARIKAQTPPPGTVCPAGYLVKWGMAEIQAALGIRELGEDEEHVPALFSWGKGKDKKRYAADNNATNRPLSEENWKSLMRHFIAGTWAITGETLIFDEDGMSASSQHRLGASFIACLVDPDATFYFVLVQGIDKDVIDFIDTGKSRDLKDITVRHSETMLTADELRDLSGAKYRAAITDVRKKIAGDIKQAMSILHLRSHSKDVHSSTTEWKNDKSLYFTMVKRFGPCQFTDATGQSVETTTLTRAANRIFAYDSEMGGALNKYFGRGKLLAALVLASNADNPTEIDVETFINGLGKEQTRIVFKLPEQLALDLTLVDEFCDVAADKVGPLAPLYNYLADHTGKNKIDGQYKFGALVNAIKEFQEHSTLTTIPAQTNEAGEVVTPELVKRIMPPLAKHTVPSSPPKKDGQAQPLNWPAFGGFDVGYLTDDKKKEIKASYELEQAAEESQAEETKTDPLAS